MVYLYCRSAPIIYYCLLSKYVFKALLKINYPKIRYLRLRIVYFKTIYLQIQEGWILFYLAIRIGLGISFINIYTLKNQQASLYLTLTFKGYPVSDIIQKISFYYLPQINVSSQDLAFHIKAFLNNNIYSLQIYKEPIPFELEILSDEEVFTYILSSMHILIFVYFNVSKWNKLSILTTLIRLLKII